MFAVYEVVDLGIVSSLNRARGHSRNPDLLSLIQANRLLFHPDPIHDDTVYVYHSFGVHVLNFNSVLQNLAIALKEEAEGGLDEAVQKSGNTSVQAILDTFSVEKR